MTKWLCNGFSMIKEPKNIDSFTTGKQPSEKDFLRISEWILKNKEREKKRKIKIADKV